ncbi:MAG: thioesterase domain-containing protein [Comamonadaceae bacterium]|nr:thioesterase domain-containing protein [Comamonadaceae bacterium]
MLLYRSLSTQLSPNRSIYALQAKGLDGKSDLSTTVDQMAMDYLDEILKVRAQGPIYLLGFSLGGFIAYEIAQRLQERKIEVGFVAMVDSVATLAREEVGKSTLM